MGRKNKYDEAVKPYLEEVKGWIRTMTERQIASRLGISETSFERYKKKHPELCEALDQVRKWLRADAMSALIKKACGHKVTVQHKRIRTVDGKKTIDIDEDEVYYPPDTGALHLLLKNIDPEWRNDDMTTVRLKQAHLELEKEKAANNNW